MSKREHYIYVSNSSLNFNRFVIELPKTLHLEGDWVCALVECSVKFFSKDVNSLPRQLYILSDFCVTSFVNNLQLPVLRKMILPKKSFMIFRPVTQLYIPIKQNWLNRLEFSVCDDNLCAVNVDENTSIEFTLHLKNY